MSEKEIPEWAYEKAHWIIDQWKSNTTMFDKNPTQGQSLVKLIAEGLFYERENSLYEKNKQRT